MGSAVTITELLAICSVTIMLLLSVVGFFVKRELSHVEEKIATNKTEAKAALDKIDTEIRGLRVFFETSCKEISSRFEAKIESYSRESVADGRTVEERIKEAQEEARSDVEELKKSLHILEKSFLERFAQFGERYLLKESFIRDNTMLDSKITTTSRSMAKIEQSLDAMLQRFLDEPPKNKQGR